ncbi:DUF4132 domain-containing protein [Hymenobacter chitinivorans]|uniref:Uncharacterized protein DUF4132 n=1 Tax=Hymenobacter chitinivorans DSM 11115 TaxID=1121954 RepID=A0A2M9BMN3_9BACT|nr:DUF4132 domain-containing protein [Hymenobacter chitinivorans]PJJ59208.1 uncharacterized protein DUF4132 [Hymenobacter chitinivorans DSM 11115]
MASTPETAPAPPEVAEMQDFIQAYLREIKQRKLSYYDLKLTELTTYQELKDRDAAYKGRLVLALAATIRNRDNSYEIRYQLDTLLKVLLRSTLELAGADYVRLLGLYGLELAGANINSIANALALYPVLPTLTQLEKQAKKQPLEEPVLDYLRQLLAVMAVNSSDNGLMKLRVKVQEILGQDGESNLPTVIFSESDAFGQALNEFVGQLPPSAAKPWLRLLQVWQKTTGAQPTAKFRKETEAAVAGVEPAEVRRQYGAWLSELARLPVQEFTRTTSYGHGGYTYSEWHFLSDTSQAAAKGLIWSSMPLLDGPMLGALAELAVKCYRKIPAKGQVAPSLGNACVLALAQGGMPGVAHLSRLKLKVKQANTQALIEGHLEKAAQELGVTPAEIEDMAVPTLGLTQGQAEYHYGDYQARLHLVEGKAEVQWRKDGKELKSAPAALKKTHAAELKELKETQAQVQQNLTAQRERLDRSFVTGRRLPLAWFEQYYFGHELLSYLVRPLIWRFHHPDGSHTDALWLDEAWCDAQGQPVAAPAPEAQVQLWHPVLAPMAEVLAWRRLLDERQLRQPLKQAYRELYLLTPPEERTGTYSNRMAAHILRQHQFNSLTKLRGWRYRLMGAYDKGYETDSATLDLPAYGLQAQFWVSEVNADNAWNDAGIWNYVSTDQVRFTTGHGVVPLTDVPALVFSEVMRDVDLFVGVASVGNDPQWRDNGGLPAYRNYWESYSFGELGEVAKNRKLALERLVPRMKIGKVSEIQDRFLVVRGKRRTYKIHLGSGNILMEPNDQYLCIVPDRSAKAPSAADVFLPFEGDAVLSIILSKALLLMDDDKITDDTINRQIGR